MATIHVRGEDGEWKPLPGVRAYTMDGATRRIDFHVAANLPAKVLVRNADGRYAIAPDSDNVTVTLADDATWCHMRGLYAPPETLEGE